MSQPPKQDVLDKEARKKQKLEQKAAEEEEKNKDAYWKKNTSEFAQKGDIRWHTLSHNGVVFPPPYEPHGIPVMYGVKEFHMTPEEEELATLYADMRDTPFYQKPVFRRNFFAAWREVLDKRGPHPIQQLELVDFTRIYEWCLADRLKRKSLSPEEKKKKKEEQKALDAKYKWCMWDGRKEKIANYIVEKPGLFRGRGEHPKTGMFKARVYPEDVTINIGEGEEVPPPPPGHKWKEVVHDHTVTWLAMWKDSVNDNHKYVMLAASSSIKGQSDIIKFEKARSLEQFVADIRASYARDFHSPDVSVQQRAVATYFIDKLALRAGNKKDSSEEADTVGCCSLKKQNITPLPDNKLYFHFKGKDSIEYINTVEVDPVVHALISKWHKQLGFNKPYFGTNEPSDVNDHLKKFMPGLTAKVFRTYNASRCLQNEFDNNPCPLTASEPERVMYFNEANKKVAILCNHQRSVPKSFGNTKMKMEAKTDECKEHVERLQKCIEIERRDGHAAAMKYFYEEEDRVQEAWLSKYGTDAEKAAYEEVKKTRDEGLGSKRARPSTTKTETARKPATRTKTTKTKEEEEGDSGDETLLNVLNEDRKERKAAKPAPPADDSSDEDLVAALKSKGIAKGKKAAPKEKSPSPKKASPAKKPSPKKAKPSPKKGKPSPKKAKPSPKKGKASPKKASPKTSPKKASPKAVQQAKKKR